MATTTRDSARRATSRSSSPADRDARRAAREEAERIDRHAARKRLLVMSGVALAILGILIGYSLSRPDGWQRDGAPITVSGWAPYWQTDSAYASYTENLGVFEDLSLFAYQATSASDITAFDGLPEGVQSSYRLATRTQKTRFTASIVDGTEARVMAGILADPTSRGEHVRAIRAFAEANDFDGIDIDYEKFAFSDGRETWDATRPNWVEFIEELATALHADGRTLSVSAPPGGDYSVYDYEAIGRVVDRIRIMAYDYNTSEPGPIAPIDWVRDVVATAKELAPAKKLVLGIPVYGYDWPVTTEGTCPGTEDDAPGRRNVSTASATALAAANGVTPTFDETAQESTFQYVETLAGVDLLGQPVSCRVTRVVWFADARAVHDRAYIAERQGLSGIALWSLGSDSPEVWQGIAAARDDVEEWPPGAASASSAVESSTTVAG